MEARVEEGYYLGPVDGTKESLVLHKEGAVRVRTFRRLDPDQRWSAGILECGGSVLQPDPLRPNEIKIGIRVPIPIDPDVHPDPSIQRGAYSSKRVQRAALTAGILKKYGDAKKKIEICRISALISAPLN